MGLLCAMIVGQISRLAPLTRDGRVEMLATFIIPKRELCPQHEPGGASPWGLLAQLGSSSWLAYLPAAVRIHLGLATQMNEFVDKGWQSKVLCLSLKKVDSLQPK